MLFAIYLWSWDCLHLGYCLWADPDRQSATQLLVALYAIGSGYFLNACSRHRLGVMALTFAHTFHIEHGKLNNRNVLCQV